MAVHPAGFLASSSRTGCPPADEDENRPATWSTAATRASAAPGSVPRSSTRLSGPPGTSFGGHGRCGHDRHGRVGPVELPREPEIDREPGRRRPAPAPGPPARLRRCGRANVHWSQAHPPRIVEDDPAPAGRAAHGVADATPGRPPPSGRSARPWPPTPPWGRRRWPPPSCPGDPSRLPGPEGRQTPPATGPPACAPRRSGPAGPARG